MNPTTLVDHILQHASDLCKLGDSQARLPALALFTKSEDTPRYPVPSRVMRFLYDRSIQHDPEQGESPAHYIVSIGHAMVAQFCCVAGILCPSDLILEPVLRGEKYPLGVWDTAREEGVTEETTETYGNRELRVPVSRVHVEVSKEDEQRSIELAAAMWYVGWLIQQGLRIKEDMLDPDDWTRLYKLDLSLLHCLNSYPDALRKVNLAQVAQRLRENPAADGERLQYLSLLFVGISKLVQNPAAEILDALSLVSIASLPDLLRQLVRAFKNDLDVAELAQAAEDWTTRDDDKLLALVHGRMGSARRRVIGRVANTKTFLVADGDGLHELDLDFLSPDSLCERIIGTAQDFYLRQAYSPDAQHIQLEWWQAGAVDNPKRWLLRDDGEVFRAIRTSAFADVVIADTSALINLDGW